VFESRRGHQCVVPIHGVCVCVVQFPLHIQRSPQAHYITKRSCFVGNSEVFHCYVILLQSEIELALFYLREGKNFFALMELHHCMKTCFVDYEMCLSSFQDLKLRMNRAIRLGVKNKSFHRDILQGNKNTSIYMAFFFLLF
jgi:hypothetical protein